MRLLVEATNGVLGVEGDRIVPPTGRFDIVIGVDGELRPGLINAHEHLHRNHYGRLGDPPYRNSYEWGEDIHARQAEVIADARARPRTAALLHGAEKNLRAGVTTVVHHDPWEALFEQDFPLRVLRVPHAHALRTTPPDASQSRDEPFMIHLAEGTDGSAADEIRDLDARGLVTRHLLAVHVVGADADGIRRLRDAGACVIWCPTSNLFLLGRTLPSSLLAPGIDVLVGSDSLLSGAGTLLDELRAAHVLGFVSDTRLMDAVGCVAARRFGIDAPSLDPGARADFAVFRAPLLEATCSDVALVVAGGRVRVLEPSLVPSLDAIASSGTVTEMDGVARWVSLGSS